MHVIVCDFYNLDWRKKIIDDSTIRSKVDPDMTVNQVYSIRTADARASIH